MVLDDVFQVVIQDIIQIVGTVSLACAGVVGAALTIFAARWAVTKVMSFFTAITYDPFNDPYCDYDEKDIDNGDWHYEG